MCGRGAAYSQLGVAFGQLGHVAGGEYFDRNVAAHVIPIQAKYMFNIIFVWA